jgi:hypothetical protein
MSQSSSCQNGHFLRIELNAPVMFIGVYGNTETIMRNANGHPWTRRGVVEGISHADQTVVIRPMDKPSVTETMDWDMVVASEDEPLPVALLGTNEPNKFLHSDRGWMFRRTIDFKHLRAKMPAMKEQYVQSILEEAFLVMEPAKENTLASVAFGALMKGIANKAAQERIPFFVAAMETVVPDDE